MARQVNAGSPGRSLDGCTAPGQTSWGRNPPAAITQRTGQARTLYDNCLCRFGQTIRAFRAEISFDLLASSVGEDTEWSSHCSVWRHGTAQGQERHFAWLSAVYGEQSGIEPFMKARGFTHAETLTHTLNRQSHTNRLKPMFVCHLPTREHLLSCSSALVHPTRCLR